MSNEIINPYQTFYDDSGIPLANGTISFLVNTTTTLGTIYSDEALTVAQANPYPLDAYGRIKGDVKYTGLRTLLIKTDLGATVRTIDNVATVVDTIGEDSRLNPLTTSVMANDVTFSSADVGKTVIRTKEFSTGNGGGATYDVVLTSSVTPNTYNIIVGVADATISFVLQIDNKVIVEQWVGNVAAALGAIQAAIEYAAANELPLKSCGAFSISGTLIIPQRNPSPTFAESYKQIYDFGGTTFTLDTNAIVFTSGYDNGGTLTTNVGTPYDTYYSDNIELICGNMQSSIGQIGQPALSIQDWHQGCVIKNFSSSIHQQAGKFINCFYTEWYNMYSTIVAPIAGARWVWEGATNLCKISRFVAGNSVTGYRFDGPLTATNISNMSFEGMTYGVEFNSSVYDVEINHSYFEAITDTMIVTTDSVHSLKLANNYFNFLSSASTYLISYFAAPANNFDIDSSNYYDGMPSRANLIKNREDVYGDGIKISFAKNNGVLADTLVDPLVFGANITIDETIDIAGLKANVNNDFAIGNYSGRFTTGKDQENGFVWVDNTDNTLVISTKIKQNNVQITYVHIVIAHSAGPTTVAGQFIGNTFYEYDGAGLTASTALTGSTDGSGFFQINGGVFYNTVITSVFGEVRLI